jgi:hypothetical protein
VRIIRRISGKQLVRERTESVDIIELCRCLTAQLLGARREGRQALPTCIGRRGGSRSCRTEIRELYAPACIKQHVAWLQVAMNDSPLVRMFQCLSDVQKDWNDVEITSAS